MSKSLKKVVGIAASLIVPYASPIIAGAIGLSGAVGGVLGSAITGAALGGAGTAALGGDWKKGALFGGIGGGIGGYMNPGGGSELLGIKGDSSLGRWGAASSGAGGANAGNAGLSTGGNVAQGAAPTPTSTPTPTPGTATPDWGGGLTVDTSTAPPPGMGQRLTAALTNAPRELLNKVSDPKFLADLTLKAGMMLSGQALAGNMAGMSPEEQMLLKAQMEDLQTMRAQNKDLYDIRMAQAQKLLGEAEYFDPVQLGKQAARQEQVRSGLATTEGLRGIRDEGKRQAEARRFALGASKNVGTAFEQGQQTGIAGRLQTRAAGLSALPTPPAMTSYAQLAGAYGNQYERQRQARQDIGSFFGGLTSDKSTGDTGDSNVGYSNIFRGIG